MSKCPALDYQWKRERGRGRNSGKDGKIKERIKDLWEGLSAEEGEGKKFWKELSVEEGGGVNI